MPHILVLDNDPDWRDLIKNGFKNLPYNFVFETDLNMAFGLITEKEFDLVISNWHLDYNNDCENFIKAVKKLQPKTRLLIITGSFNGNSDGTIKIIGKTGKGNFIDNLRDEVKKVVQKRTISWLHLSDFHVRINEDYRFSWKALKSALVKDLEAHQKLPADQKNQRLAGVQFQPDLLFVTGDVAYSGKREEYFEAQNFIEQVQRIVNVGKSRTFFVPGNHDTSREAANRNVFTRNYDFLKFDNYKLKREVWDSEAKKSVQDQDLMDVFNKKFEEYLEFVSKCSDQDPSSPYYVTNLSLNDLKVSIIGICSAFMSHKDGEDVEGGLWIGRKQAEDLMDKLNDDRELTFSLIHHPRKRLNEYDQLIAFQSIYDETNIFLNGHEHVQEAVKIASPGKDKIMIAGGSIHQGSSYYYHSYSYGTLDLDSGELEIIFRRSTAAGNLKPMYIRDNTTYPDDAPTGSLSFKVKF